MVITSDVGMLVSTNVYAELQDNQNYSQTEMGVGWRGNNYKCGLNSF